jgi:response regulator RpfG family c-di-GMP phosphodiesterase
VAPLAHAELADLLRHESGRLFDRELVDVLLQLIAEREGGKP